MKLRSQDWTPEQVALLRAMYPTSSMESIIKATGKTQDSVYSKAKTLGLRRENTAKFKPGEARGHKYPKGNVPWNAGKSVFKITTRDLVLGEFKRNPAQTTITLAHATGARRSGCWTVCNDLVSKGLAHISGWICDKSTNWNKLAIYTYGPGDSVEWTPRQQKNQPDEDPYEIQPIPRPPIGLWGLCWPVNQSLPSAGERNSL